jgi:hypothetical protein
MTYETKIQFFLDDGQLCQIAVIDYCKTEPNHKTLDSDIDFYGGEEFDYDLLDMEDKIIKPDLSDKEIYEIEQAISDFFEGDSYDD